MRTIRTLQLGFTAVFLLGMTMAMASENRGAVSPPKRVVSMNACTDQLAMLLAGPGQLISVSYLAHDPRVSAMAKEASKFPKNKGLAEEIFLLEPDLVIAGTFTTRATVDMLQRLGIPVVQFEPANSLEDISKRLEKMGAVLGRESHAKALISQFNSDLAASRLEPLHRPRAATYYSNNYTSGAGSLANSVIEAAGLSNIAADLGFEHGGTLALETLVMENPEIIVTGSTFENPALAQEVLAHPAVKALQDKTTLTPVADRDWICGTPFVISAIKRLAAVRDAVMKQ